MNHVEKFMGPNKVTIFLGVLAVGVALLLAWQTSYAETLSPPPYHAATLTQR